MHKCSENLLWVCAIFYGFDRKMALTLPTVSTRYEPDELIDNRPYYDGVAYERRFYADFHDMPLDTLNQDVSSSYNFANIDFTVEDEQRQVAVRGVRTVRNIAVTVDCDDQNRGLQNIPALVRVDCVLAVQRSTAQQIFTEEILDRSKGQLYVALGGADSQQFSLCYPGVIRLYSGDRLVLGVIKRTNAATYGNYSFNIRYDIRFG